MTVEWVTAAEWTPPLTLYRAPTLDFSQAAAIHTVNAARRPGGSTYTFADQPAGAGPWWYWLESSSTTGELTRYPPASTAAGRLGPALPRLPAHGRETMSLARPMAAGVLAGALFFGARPSQAADSAAPPRAVIEVAARPD